MHRRRLLAVLALAALLVLAGCGAETGSNGTAETSATSSPAPTTTTDVRTMTADQSSSGIEVVNTTDADSDGNYESFGVQVRANTLFVGGDDGEGDPGEPYFTVQVNDGEQFDTGEVAREDEFTTTIPINASVIPEGATGELNVTVELLDRDTMFDDSIELWSMIVPYEPAETPTPTATPTATPTSTPTPTPEPAASVPPEISGGEARQATVTRVVDGDTMEVEFADGETDTVRLIGVDTPEMTFGDVSGEDYEGIPSTQAARDHLYNWGQRASEFATDQLDGQEVRVVTDAEGDRRGSFGRLLAYIYVGGENFNRQLLDQGYARVYDSQFSLREAFDSAESQARSNDVGLWDFDAPDTATPTPTPDGGDGSGQLAIADIQPEGDDETITLQNTGGSAIDLSGYTVVFDDDQTYTIGGVTLGAGETLTVHTGEGSDSASDVYAGFGRSVLNNDGDTVTIRDDSGTVVAQQSYGDGG